jgi:hypothetical protein
MDSKIWPINYIGNLVAFHSQLSDNMFPIDGVLVGVKQVFLFFSFFSFLWYQRIGKIFKKLANLVEFTL